MEKERNIAGQVSGFVALLNRLVEPEERRGPTRVAANYGERKAAEYWEEIRQSKVQSDTRPSALASGRAILESHLPTQIEILLAVVREMARFPRGAFSTWRLWNLSEALALQLLRRKLPYTSEDILVLVTAAVHFTSPLRTLLPGIVKTVETYAAQNELSCELQTILGRLRAAIAAGRHSDRRSLVASLDMLLGEPATFVLEPGDPWADAVNAELVTLEPRVRAQWDALLRHTRASEQVSPSLKWLSKATLLLAEIGEEAFQTRVLRWFEFFVASGRPDPTGDHPSERYDDSVRISHLLTYNCQALKGLVWCCRFFQDENLTHGVGNVAEACYKKIPNIGQRSVKTGNACVQTLGIVASKSAIERLNRLQSKVKYPAAIDLIEKTLTEAAARSGVSCQDLEEMSVPSHGLQDGGFLRWEFGAFAAELVLTHSGDVDVRWFDAEGVRLKSVPTEVKRSYRDGLAALKRSTEEIRQGLAAQRSRLERLLTQERVWTVSVWRERYLDPPLLANLTRRLIWQFGEGANAVLGMAQDGVLVDLENRPLADLTAETSVRLWHPIVSSPETVLAWRKWLEHHGIVQPFKQAHREVYLLTEAEIGTRTHSNRFAAHILKQHQLAALCRQRGWQYTLQGLFDRYSVPDICLPQHGMRVEFWVQPVEGDNLLADSDVYLYVSTDQVRFHDFQGNLLPLTEIPALLFSEIMRDVDLFVGVCSIGNDPHWGQQDHQGRMQDAWHGFSFGDLSVSAHTRKDVLARLLPRLQIASQCRLEGKFLTVQGTWRTYKIHLGSGNILMEPNDQYLCIVPRAGTVLPGDVGSVFLPFEGDTMLSVILSKAFLLADDTQIKDTSIVSQIRRGG